MEMMIAVQVFELADEDCADEGAAAIAAAVPPRVRPPVVDVCTVPATGTAATPGAGAGTATTPPRP